MTDTLPPLPPEPWLRFEAETEKEFEAFCQYRNQPIPRSLARVYGTTKAVQVEWYHKHRWVDRCKAWDRHLDSIRLKEQEEIVKQTAREITGEHMRLLKDLRAVAAIEAEKFAAQALAGELPSVKVGELTKLAELVVKLDRLVRGESTDKVETAVDLSHLSTEELLDAEELLKKLGGA